LIKHILRNLILINFTIYQEIYFKSNSTLQNDDSTDLEEWWIINSLLVSWIPKYHWIISSLNDLTCRDSIGLME